MIREPYINRSELAALETEAKAAGKFIIRLEVLGNARYRATLRPTPSRSPVQQKTP